MIFPSPNETFSTISANSCHCEFTRWRPCFGTAYSFPGRRGVMRVSIRNRSGRACTSPSLRIRPFSTDASRTWGHVQARAAGSTGRRCIRHSSLRSHELPFGARQSSPPRSPHRRLLVDAYRARRHSQSPGIGHCRVRDAATSSLENRRPCRRDHQPHSPCVRRGMSRSRPLPQLARRTAPARSVTDWASARSPAHSSNAYKTGRCRTPVKNPDGSPMPAASPPSDVKNDRTLVNRSG